MFKCFFLSSFFFGFSVVNFGAFDFVDSTGGDMSQNLPEGVQKIEKEQGKHEGLNINNEKTNGINNVMKGGEVLPAQNEDIKGKQNEEGRKLVAPQDDDFRQLVFYYYIAVSFLLYAYKKVDPEASSFSKLGDEKYAGPLYDDVFAVYKEFSGSDSKGMSTYHAYLSHFCEDALKKFLGGKKKISYCDAYKKMCAMIRDFLSQVEKINIELEEDAWEYGSVQWAFTVALQVFAYKKIYEYLKENIPPLEGNNKDAALQHDLVYVKFMSEMLHNIFKNVLEAFSSDGGNTIRSRDLFFLRDLKLRNIGPKNSKNMFYSAFSSLVFRPAYLDGSAKNFLDCFFPIIDRMKRINKG